VLFNRSSHLLKFACLKQMTSEGLMLSDFVDLRECKLSRRLKTC